MNLSANKFMEWKNATSRISEMVDTERMRQVNKWGLQRHELCEWIAILAEEVGELSQECLRERFDSDEKDTINYAILKEAVQVAAVASAIAQYIESNQPV